MYYHDSKLFLSHQDTFACKQEHYKGLKISSKHSSLCHWYLVLWYFGTPTSPGLKIPVCVLADIVYSLGSNVLPEKSQASFWRLKSLSEHWTPSTSYITWLCQLCIMWLQDGVHSGTSMKSQHERQITVTLNNLQKHWGWWADLSSSHISVSRISVNSREQGSEWNNCQEYHLCLLS